VKNRFLFLIKKKTKKKKKPRINNTVRGEKPNKQQNPNRAMSPGCKPGHYNKHPDYSKDALRSNPTLQASAK
jgi:hypothetical protein